MSDERWIVVRHWADFQHYRDRDPVWIKNYVRLLHDPDYLGLPEGARSILHGLWLAYASSNAQLPLNTRSLSRQLALRVTSAQLERLKEAGFIEFSASRPLALAHSREAEAEKEKDHPLPLPQNAEGESGNHSRSKRRLTAAQLRKFTGCRITRGTHASGYMRDPLGQDRPPPDWPHEKPSKAEVLKALEARDG